MKYLNYIAAGALLIGLGLWSSFDFYGQAGDQYGLVRYCLRMLVVVPLVTILAIMATLAYDAFTPAEWMPEEWKDEKAKAIILAVLIYCVFWLGVQG